MGNIQESQNFQMAGWKKALQHLLSPGISTKARKQSVQQQCLTPAWAGVIQGDRNEAKVGEKGTAFPNTHVEKGSVWGKDT